MKIVNARINYSDSTQGEPLVLIDDLMRPKP
jgi:hypothetical protein